jgi:hypothetical protein
MKKEEEMVVSLMVDLNLDDIWAEEEWSTSVGEMIRDEMRGAFKREIADIAKNDRKFRILVDNYWNVIYEQMVQKITPEVSVEDTRP